ncbi:outer membrane protein [Providencia burhodogranariea]|uniref:Surface protein n=1 Tax=Providencia burhodogranariea DSM 19968 TaxID=1141662 RepID=K8X078_9GAMM|nr:outer membrane beta-barrel protein [Providencia burhodogranariea]EKT61860.1 surface protein precursor [Providencia burhodogranariea DSM 19968]
MSEAESTDNDNYHFGSKNKGVFGGGIALGYDFYEQFNLPIRTELDIMMRGKASANNNFGREFGAWGHDSDDTKNEVTLNTFMLNSFYDFRNESAFTPYISAGIGLASLKHKADYKYSEWDANGNYINNSENQFSKSKTNNNFAWSLGLGMKYAINTDFSMDLSYRYLDAGKSTISNTYDSQTQTSKVKAQSNDIMLGVTYRF